MGYFDEDRVLRAVTPRVREMLPPGYALIPRPAEDETEDDALAVIGPDGKDTGVHVQVGANYLVVNRWVDGGTAMRHWPTRGWTHRGLDALGWRWFRRDLAEALAFTG